MQKKLLAAISILLIFMSSLAFSAFSTSLTITSEVRFRALADIRVNGVSLDSANGGTLGYESDYSKNTVSNGFILPTSGASISYSVQVDNLGDLDYSIYDIFKTTSDNGLTVTISGYNLQDVIPAKTSVNVILTYTTSNPSENVINVVQTFDFKKVFYVRYETGTTQVIGAQTKYEGVDLALTSTQPTKTGYTFARWNTKSDGTGVNYNSGATYTIDDDATMYARYTLDTYTITYNLNNGTNNQNNPATYTYETNDITLGDASKTGYTFNGWTGNGTTSPTKNLVLPKHSTGNKTFTANFTANTYTINYTMNGGNNPSTKPTSGTYDQDVIISNPTKTVTITPNVNNTGADIGNATSANQAFAGWSATVGSNAKTGTTANPTAAWDGTATTNTYFKNLKETGTVTMTANWTPVAVTLPSLSKTGYTCKWYTDPTNGTELGLGGASYTPSANSNQAITAYARCTANAYTVTAKANGGSISSTSGWTGTGNTATKTVTYDQAYGTLPTISRSGYTFKGWNGKNLLDFNDYINSSNFSVTRGTAVKGDNYLTLTSTGVDCYTNPYTGVNTYKIPVQSRTTYTLSWTVDDPSVVIRVFVFHFAPGNTSYASTSSVEGSNINSITFTTRSDAEYISFRVGVSETGKTVTYSNLQLEEGNVITTYEPYYITSSTNVTRAGNHEINAIWERDTYTITYALNNGTASGTNPTEYNVETETFTLNNPTKTLTFVGHYNATSGANAASGQVTVGNNTTAQQTFKGWSGTDLTGETNQTVTISQGSTGNRSYEAHWTAVAPTSLPTVTRTGYTCGWSTSSTGTTIEYDNSGNHNYPTSAITEGMEATVNLYAVCVPNTYTIGYTMNGGTQGTNAPTTGTYDTDVVISKPTKTFTVNIDGNSQGATVKSGNTVVTSASSTQTFAGWTGTNINISTAKFGAAANPSTAWNGTRKIGVSTDPLYLLNLRSESGTVTMVANWTPVAVTLPIVEKTGYQCKYNTASNGSGTDYTSGGSYTPSATTNNAKLYVICSANTYNIAYVMNNGNDPSSKPTTGTYDANVNISNPTKTVTITGDVNGTGASVGSDTSSTQTFLGWSSTVGSNAQSGTSTSNYASWNGTATTNTYFKNLTNTNNATVTMTANWTPVNVALPSLSKTGFICKWYSEATGGSELGLGGDSYTPTANSAQAITVYARCSERDDTPYRVNHYVHDLGTNTYTLNSYDDLTGRTNATLTLANLKKTISGFTYTNGYLTGDTTKPTSGAVTTTTILADGSRVINLYYRRNYLYIRYDMNGGSLASTHGSKIGSSGTLVTSTANTPQTDFLRGVYGSKVGEVTISTYAVSTSGLHNWNSTSNINIEKTGYVAKSNAQWNTAADGTGTSYNQDTATYDANGFAGADLSTGDAVVTVYVNWTPVNYTLTYALNNGTVASANPASYNIESNPITLNNPTKTLTFVGHYNATSGANASSTDGVTIGDDTTQAQTFAGWSGTGLTGNNNNPVTIATGSTGNRSYTAHWTATAGTVPTVTRTGYTCGWNTSESGTTIEIASAGSYGTDRITEGMGVTVNLYAVCTPNTYTVTAKANGGTIASTTGWTGTGNTATKTVTYDAAYGTLPSVTRTGYTFQGWNGKNLFSGLVKGIGLNSVTGIQCTDTTSAVSEYIPVDFSNGRTYYLSGLTNTLYSFIAIYDENKEFLGRTAGGPRTAILLDSSSIQAYRNFDINSAKYIRVDHYQNTNVSGTINAVDSLSIQLEEGSTTTPYEPYYIADTTTVTRASNHEINAEWSINNPATPTISGGTTKVYGSSATTLTCSTSTDYASGTTKYYSFGYASSDGGTPGNWTTASTSNQLSISATEYVGQRWYSCRVYASDGTLTTSTVASAAASDTEMTINNAKLTFDTNSCGTINNNGTSPAYVKNGTTGVLTTIRGTAAGTIPTLSKTGYTFNGWYDGTTKVINTDGTIVASVSNWTDSSKNWLISADKTLKASCTAKTYTLTINPQGGTYSGSTSNATKQMTYDATTNNDIGAPTRSGYTFNGWYTSANGGTQIYDSNGQNTNASSYWTAAYSTGKWKYDGDVTVYAKWTKAVSSLTNTLSATDFVYSGSAQGPSVTVKDGNTTLTLNTDYTVSGNSNTNVGQYAVTITGANVYNTTTKAYYAGTTTLTYYINNAKITWNANSCGTISGTSPAYVKKGATGVYTTIRGTSAGTIPTVSKTGYTFNGWYDGSTKVINADGTIVASVSNWTDSSKNWLITADKTLTASCVANTYTVIFDKNATAATGTMGNQTFAYDESKKLTKNAYANTGYTFAGWNVLYSNNLEKQSLSASRPEYLQYADLAPYIDRFGGDKTYRLELDIKSADTTNAHTINIYCQNGSDCRYSWAKSVTVSSTEWTHVIYDFVPGTANSSVARATLAFYGTYNTGNAPIVKNVRFGLSPTYADEETVSNLTSTANGQVTLYAGWTPHIYTVSYNGNGNTGGSTASSTHVYDEAKALTTNGFTRSGYTFAGWNTQADGSGTNYTNSQSVINLTATDGATITLYAKWSKAATSLTKTLSATDFIYNGSAQGPSVTVKDGNTTLTAGTDYTISGNSNTNVGEYTITITGSNVYNSTTNAYYTGTTTITYYINNAQLTFDKGSCTSTSGTTTLYTKKGATKVYTGIRNTTEGSIPTASKSGYTFQGWYTASTGGSKVLNANGGFTGTAVTNYTNATSWQTTANQTLYAQCTRDNYAITYTLNNGTNNANNPSSYNVESSAITLAAPTKTLTFKGNYNTTAAANAASGSGVTIGSNTQAAQTFAGWTGSNGTTAQTSVTIPAGSTGDKAYTAHWTAVAPATLPTVTKVGYTCGWSTSSSGTTIEYQSGATNYPTSLISEGQAATVNLYAVCTPKTYTLTINPQNGTYAGSTSNATKTMTYDSTNNNDIGVPTRDGYTFAGWYTAANGGTQLFDTSGHNTNASSYWTAAYSTGKWKYDGNVTVYAKWTKAVSTLTNTLSQTNYVYNGSAQGPTVTVKDGSTTLTLNIDYTVSGNSNTNVGQYSVTVTGSSAYNSTTKAYYTGTTTLTYYINNAKLTFDAGSCTSGSGTLYTKKGATVVYTGIRETTTTGTIPTASKSGFTFQGWYTASSGGSKVLNANGTFTGTAVTNYTNATTWQTVADQTLYAQCTRDSYSITYAMNNGTNNANNPSTYTIESEAITLAAPTKTLTFHGNVNSTSGANAASGQVTIENNDQTAAQTFAGWTGSNGTTAQTTVTIPSGSTGDKAYTAHWTAVAPAKLPKVTRTGYTCGWSTSSTGTTIEYASEATNYPTSAISEGQAATVNLYAVCTPKTYTLTINPQNGTYAGSTSNATKTMTYDSTNNNDIGVPTRDGYTFAGWYTAASGGTQLFGTDGHNVNANGYWSAAYNTGVWKYDGNVTVYAKWTEKTYTLTINPNGGTLDGSTSTVTRNLNYSDVSNVNTPTRTGYTFGGWSELESTRMLAHDFSSVGKYNNNGGTTVAVASQTKSTDNPLTGMSEEYIITNSGAAATTPGLGGWYRRINAAANKKYAVVFVAKLPAGYYFHPANNSLGTGGSTQWLTSNEGTGNWQTYAYQVNTGTTTPTANTFSYVYVSTDKTNAWGSVHAETGAYTAYLAYTNIFDITSNSNGIGQYDGTGTLTANWTANVYAITLNKQNGSGGTDTVYEKYNTGYYTDSAATTQMTTSANGVTVPTRSGYTFDGYYTAANGGTQYIDATGKLTSSASATNFTATGNLYAHWSKSVANLTNTLSDTNFVYSGSAQGPSVTVKDGSTTLTLNTDYTVSGNSNTNVGQYTVTITGANVYNSTTKAYYTGTTTMTYNINNATLTFDVAANSGTISGTSPLYIRKGATGAYAGIRNTTAATIPTATRTGYTFQGWYTDSSSGTKVINADKSIVASVSNWTDASKNWLRTADSTLYAQFTANELTFNNQTLSTGTYGTAYTSGAFTAATNGTGSYTYTLVSGYPTGATINSTNRTISFTNSTNAGTYSVVVRAKDNNTNKTKDATMTIVINKAKITIPTSPAAKIYNGLSQNSGITTPAHTTIVSTPELVNNGDGSYGNNTNFSSWTYDSTNSYNGSTGSFKKTGSGTPITNEYFALSTEDATTTLSFDAKTDGAVNSNWYSFIYYFDVDKNKMNAQHYMYIIGSTTTLAQELKNGDTVVHLTDLTGWKTSTGTATHQRGFIFWNYTDSKGFTYPIHTYSRNVFLDKYADDNSVNVAAGTITLKTAWTGGTFPAGTPVSQSNSGSSYKYNGLVNGKIPTSWTHYSGTYNTVDYSGTNITTKAPPYAVYGKVGYIWRANDTGYITNVSVTTQSKTSGTKVGTYAIAYDIDDKNNYEWSDGTTTLKTVPWIINPKDISSTVTATLSDQIYTGSALTPNPTLKDGSTTLVKDTDYSLIYKNNTNVGQATVYIVFKGNYSGTKTLNFYINNAQLTFDKGSCTSTSGTTTLYTKKGATKVYTGIRNTTEGSIPTASKSGYTFQGWYTASTGGSKVLNANGGFTGTAVTNYTNASSWQTVANQTLYAQCTRDNYTISYSMNNGTNNANNPSSYNVESSAITLAAPTKTLIFKGNYNTTAEANAASGSGVTIGSNTQAAQTFVGWTGSNGTTAQTSVTIPAGSTGDKAYTAHWTAVAPETLPTVTRTGYTCGWSTSSSGTTIEYQSGATNYPTSLISEGQAATVNLYAVCTPNTYEITYDYNTTNYIVGNNLYINTDYTIDWSKSFKLNSTINIPTLGNRYLVFGNYNTTGVLNLEINNANKIRLYSNADTLSSGTIANNTDIATAFTYDGGTKAASFTTTGTNSNASVSVTNSRTDTAGAVLRIGTDSRTDNTFKTYTLKAASITDYYTYDTKLTKLPAAPTKPGYTFDGWYTAASGGTAVTTTTDVPAANTTYYAHWTANVYAITLNQENGSGGTATIYEKYNDGYYLNNSNGTVSNKMSTSANGVTVPTRSGYTFAGYYTAANGGTQYIDANGKLTSSASATQFSAAGNLYAHWTKAVSSLTNTLSATNFVYSGSAQGPSVTVKDGTTTLTLNTDYTVSGNSSTNVGEYSVTVSGKNAYNSTTKAYYTGTTTIAYYINNATLTFDATTNGGTISGTTPLYAKKGATGVYTTIRGTTGGTIPTATKTGWTFTGWYDGSTKVINADGSIVASVSNWTDSSKNWLITADKTLTAKYTITDPVAPEVTGNGTRVYNRAGRTLTCATTTTYATGTSIYYEFGYATSQANWTAGTITWLGNASTTNTLEIAKDAYIGTRYYGCRVYASDGTSTTNTVKATSAKSQSFVNARLYFDATTNGGTISGSVNLYVPYGLTNIYTGRTNTTAGTIPLATKTGYTFTGWYTAASGGSKVIASDRVVQASVSDWTNASKQWLRTSTANDDTTNVLYAQYTANGYTIGYSMNNGPDPSTKPTSGTYNADVVISNPGNKSITVTANANGSGASVGSATTGSQSFSGWTSSSAAGLGSGAKTGTAANPSTAWAGASTTNTYFRNLRDTSGTVTMTANWSGTMTLPTLTAPTGKTCKYYTDPTAGSEMGSGGATWTIPSNSATAVTAYARCSANNYTLTINPNGGTYSGSTGNSTKQMTYGTTNNNNIGVPTRDGYTFTGWYTAQTGGSLIYNAAEGNNVALSGYWSAAYNTGVWQKASDTTIYARWKVHDPAATVSGGATKIYGASTTTLTCGNTTTGYASGSTTYYAFGYASTADGTPSSWTADSTTNTYVISTANSTEFVGTRYYKCRVYVKTGSDQSETSVSTATQVTINNAKLTFDANSCGTVSGTSPAYVNTSMTGVYTTIDGTTTGTVPSTSKSGYTFNGWYTASSGGTRITNGTTILASVSNWTDGNKKWLITTDKTLYSQCSVITYNIGYTLNNGTCTGTMPATYTVNSSAITLPTTCTKTLSFVPHYSTNASSNATSGSGVSLGTTTTKAQTWTGWTGSNGTTAQKTVTIAAGSTGDKSYASRFTAVAGTLPSVTRDGYTCGWNLSDGQTTRTYSQQGTFPTSAIEEGMGTTVDLYAVCTPNQYTVSFNQNGGSGGTTTSKTATYGEAMPALTGYSAPTKSYYTFGGYYDTSASSGGTRYYKANLTSDHVFDKTTDTTLYARWTPNTYTIYYDYMGGTQGTSCASEGSTCSVGSGVTKYVCYGAKDSYTCKNVTTSITCNTASFGGTDPKPNVVKACYISDNPVSYNYDSAAITIQAPTREGYTFDGWQVNTPSNIHNTYTIPNHSHENYQFVALWTKNKYPFDLNATVNGWNKGNLAPCGTATIKINGTTVATDVTDWNAEYDYGSTWEINSNNQIDCNLQPSTITAGTIEAQTNNVFVVYTFTSKTFSYTGGIQSYKIPIKGTYTLEVWGAQGGTYSSYAGGNGGYAKGNKYFDTDTTIYIGVGQQPTSSEGGYNGGGYGNGYNEDITVPSIHCRGGGGATHIGVCNAKLNNCRNEAGGGGDAKIYIVGGGGGGAAEQFAGGAGGGTSGSAGGGTYAGGGGTQNAGGAAGYPNSATAGDKGLGGHPSKLVDTGYYMYHAGGGGGGWYGGGGGDWSRQSGYAGSGGGGSGYVSNLSSTTNTANNKTGNGQAKLTYVSTP